MAGASRVFRPFVMVLGGCCCCSAEGTAAAALVQGPRSRWSARHRGAGRSGLGVRGACVDMIKVYCEHYRELCDEDINMDGSGPRIDCPESKSVVMLCRCDLDSSFPVLLQRSPAEPRWIPRAGGVCKLQSCSGVRHNSPISPRKENKRATGCMFGNGPFRCDQRRSWDRMDGEGDIRWTLERRTGRGRLKTTLFRGRALQLQTTDLECHGVYRHVPSTTYRARRCHVVPLATAAYEINWTVPQISGMWLEIHLAATLRQTLFSIFSWRTKKGVLAPIFSMA